MIIVDRKTFLAMPANTVFSKYEPCVFEGLNIKSNSLSDDFFCQEIVSAIDADSTSDLCEKLDMAEKEGVSLDIAFDCEGRDGCFEYNQLFAVWEKKDVEKLIERLKECSQSD